MTDNFSVEGIKKFLRYKDIFNISVFESVTSTNALLKQEADKEKEGRIIIAESQTAGRGRFTRYFHSPKNCGIYMSILFKPDFPAESSVLITAAAAAAVAEAIEALTEKKAQIKWVNDVLINGKKVCGILTEGGINVKTGGFDWAIVGIGINAYEPKGGYPEEIADIAGAVFDSYNEDLRSGLAAEVINRFWDYYLSLSEKTFYKTYKERMAVLERQINVIKNDAVESAQAIDIDDNCRLLVEYKNGEREYLSSGEISIKLQPKINI